MLEPLSAFTRRRRVLKQSPTCTTNGPQTRNGWVRQPPPFRAFFKSSSMPRCTGCRELPGCSSCPQRVGPESASTTTAFFAPLGIVA